MPLGHQSLPGQLALDATPTTQRCRHCRQDGFRFQMCCQVCLLRASISNQPLIFNIRMKGVNALTRNKDIVKMEGCLPRAGRYMNGSRQV